MDGGMGRIAMVAKVRCKDGVSLRETFGKPVPILRRTEKAVQYDEREPGSCLPEMKLHVTFLAPG